MTTLPYYHFLLITQARDVYITAYPFSSSRTYEVVYISQIMAYLYSSNYRSYRFPWTHLGQEHRTSVEVLPGLICEENDYSLTEEQHNFNVTDSESPLSLLRDALIHSLNIWAEE